MEYTSAEFQNYLQKEGIIHQLTFPKSPEENGVAERLSRTLMEMVHSIYLFLGCLRDFRLKHLMQLYTSGTGALPEQWKEALCLSH